MLDKYIEDYREELIESTKGLIQIPSVKGNPSRGKPFGEDINRALVYALNLGEDLGFFTENVDGYAGFIEFGKGTETLGILGHLDVVPEGDGWTYPPYGGEIHDGRIYGRGAIDDKGPTLAALYAMKAVMESGMPVNKKVRLILGTDEESGWECMDYYFKKQPMPNFGITPDAVYPVIHAEKGILHLELTKEFKKTDSEKPLIIEIKGGERPNMVPHRCKSYIKGQDKALVAEGVSAHGSTPEAGENAISKMLIKLLGKGSGKSEIDLFIKDINNLLGEDTEGKRLGIDYSDDVSGPLTLNLGTIDVTPERGRVVIDIRYPVTYKEGEIIGAIKENLKGTGIKVNMLHGQKPLYVPKDHFLVKTLLKVYEEQTGQTHEPVAIGGGTYARALKTGVAFGPVFPGKVKLAHQNDEYIDIEDLLNNAKIYAHAIAELVNDFN